MSDRLPEGASRWSEWRLTTAPFPVELATVWAKSPTEAYAGGARPPISGHRAPDLPANPGVLLGWDGHGWQELASPTTDAIQHLVGDGDRLFLALDREGVVGHELDRAEAQAPDHVHGHGEVALLVAEAEGEVRLDGVEAQVLEAVGAAGPGATAAPIGETPPGRPRGGMADGRARLVAARSPPTPRDLAASTPLLLVSPLQKGGA